MKTAALQCLECGMAQVYTFYGGQVKPRNEKFNQTRHPYEIIFDEKTVIKEAPDAGLDIPQTA